MWTPDIDRRYLCGKDDRHLFIAQVREGNTVAEAHESLRPELARQAEMRAPGLVRRQGEWFFLPLSAEERERLAAYMRARPRALKSNRSVGMGGRPHTADAVVIVDRRFRNRHREYRRPETYARGYVRHADHLTLYLDDWRRVVRNREIAAPVDELRGARRVRWID
jgi:hypothetical protein